MSQAKTRTNFSEAPVNVKLLLIGNSSVGKSSLIRRFSDEQFLPEDKASATVGIDFIVHKIEVNNRKVKLIIWVCHTVFQLVSSYVLHSTDNTRTRPEWNGFVQ